jgi:CelD/BcsL family acetyltransferase involved in cellulose biosynthesis
MYATRIAAAEVTVAAMAGFPPEIDTLAALRPGAAGYLRAGWYGPSGSKGARTLVVRRGAQGEPIAAIPTLAFGPAIAGARKVPGPYWPMRGVPIAPDCDPLELAEALAHPAARGLGPVWRMGPVRADDPASLVLLDAARIAGWRVLARPAGTCWVVGCAALRAAGGLAAATAKRLAKAERRLAARGTVSWQYVRGCQWSDTVLAEMGTVEAGSWIAAETDGSGAKFMTPQQRAQWQSALADPVLAGMLCATILRLDNRTVAFSFDLDDGPVQYGIAGSYLTEFARFEVGKLVNYRTLTDALADGQEALDLGTGDSGYKRAMGASAAYDLVDLLFVRHAAAAPLVARVWGPPLTRSAAHG